MNAYPTNSRERDQWVLSQRPARNAVDPRRPYAFLVEEERAESGAIVPVVTIFLTNRECPWRCLMCDLWKNTLAETVPVGAIPAQIDYALAQCRTGVPPVPNGQGASNTNETSDLYSTPRHVRDRRDGCPALRQIKLYNSGSFFDPRAIPTADHPAIAGRVRAFERVIVECHPALVGESCLRFRDRLAGKLEVAMGLETAHPEVLEKLNKRMTLDQFAHAAEFLRKNEIALRVFILVKPPFLDEAEALPWAKRSLDFAFHCGATVASLIPTRQGNGALETLASRGEFSPPKLSTLEKAVDDGIGLRRGRVFADLWDLEKFSSCAECFGARQERLRQMNHTQIVKSEVECHQCAGQ